MATISITMNNRGIRVNHEDYAPLQVTAEQAITRNEYAIDGGNSP